MKSNLLSPLDDFETPYAYTRKFDEQNDGCTYYQRAPHDRFYNTIHLRCLQPATAAGNLELFGRQWVRFPQMWITGSSSEPVGSYTASFAACDELIDAG